MKNRERHCDCCDSQVGPQECSEVCVWWKPCPIPGGRSPPVLSSQLDHHHSFSFRSLLFGSYRLVNGFQKFLQHSAQFPSLCAGCFGFKGTESAHTLPIVTQGGPVTLRSWVPLVSLWKEAFAAATSITQLAPET